MKENVLEFVLVQRAFHRLQLTGHVFLEGFQVGLVVMVGIFVRR